MTATSGSQRGRAPAPHERSWEARFLDRLCATSNVTASARAAGIDVSTVYRLRRESPDFAARWRDALCEGYDNLEMDLLHRMRTGEVEPPRAAGAAPAAGSPGKTRGKGVADGGAPSARAKAQRGRRRFDNAVGLRLLMAHRATVSQERARREDLDEEAVLASINAKIDRIKTREVAMTRLLAEDGVHLVRDRASAETAGGA